MEEAEKEAARQALVKCSRQVQRLGSEIQAEVPTTESSKERVGEAQETTEDPPATQSLGKRTNREGRKS